MWRKMVTLKTALIFVGAASASVANKSALKPGGKDVSKTKAVSRMVKAPFALSIDKVHPLSNKVVPGVEQKGDSLYFYSSVDYTAIGLTNGGTYQAAIRLTPDELSPYAGYQIVEVYFYHHGVGSHSGRAIVYGAGTSTSPGDTLAVEPYTANGSGWMSIPLTSPVPIDGVSDIWVSVEVTHNAGEYPIAVDAGPAVAGKGDWFYSDVIGITWHELTEYDLNYNWNIGVVVERAGDSLDPLPPENLTAYSDYTTPTEIALSWDDPTHYIGGDTLTDFHIEVWMAGETKDTTFFDTVSGGVEHYTATGLTDGVFYTFLLRAVDVNDSASPFIPVSWYAGGSPYPAPPHDLTATVLNDFTVELSWINPSTQTDGTPLDDLAGINIYMDGTLAETYATTDTGVLVTYNITFMPGSHTFYVTAIDNEDPVHESEPSNVVEVVTSVHAGGPDGYGYTFIDSDHPDGPAFEWIDATGGTPYRLSDDDHVNVQLPFRFPFYGQTLTNINIVSNGFLTSSETDAFYNGPLPDNTINNIIAPFWDDLNPDSGGMVYTMVDTNNTGAFIVEWFEVPRYNSGALYTFEVILYPNGDIKFQYLAMEEPLNLSTIGIQGGYGSNDYYLQYTYNGDPLTVHDSLVIYFTSPRMEHDVAAQAIQAPVGGLQANVGVVPIGIVANFGSNAEIFDAVMEITDQNSNVVYCDTQSVPLDTNTIATVFFDEWTPTGDPGTNYIVTLTVYLPGDENPNNNQVTAAAWIMRVTNIPATDVIPVLDGIISPNEWGDALVIDVGDTLGMSPPAQPAGADMMYIKNGGSYLYMAFDITTDAILNDYDQIGLYIDDNGDGEWASDGSEGNNSILPVSNIGWATRVITPGPTFGDWVYSRNDRADCFAISAASGHVVYEIRLPYGNETTPDPAFLGTMPGQVFGMWIMYVEESSREYHIWWPQEVDAADWANPMVYAKLTMGTPTVEENPVKPALKFRLIGGVNPVKGNSPIMFSIPRRAKVKLALFDVAGRLVSTLADGEFDAGVHSVRLDASRLTNGVYFVRMEAGDYSAVKKITVLK